MSSGNLAGTSSDSARSPGESEQSSPGFGSEPSSSRLSKLEFLKFASGRLTKDGDAPKRRGPKPDTRPAQNEKLERNRRAQRSHRERKERYIHTLEEEILRLRDAFTILAKEKTAIQEENRQLKQLLREHGLIATYAMLDAAPESQQFLSGTGSNEADGAQQSQPLQIQHLAQPQIQIQPIQASFPLTPAQYSQIALSFILALERPCLEHIQVMTNDAAVDKDCMHGHAMMTICPPEYHSLNHPDVPWGDKTVDLAPDYIAILFNMHLLESQREAYLDKFDGELTPIAAWTKVTTHPRFAELTVGDFDSLKEVLVGHISCYGFGAVIEDYLVEDALTALFNSKPVPYPGN